MARESFSLRLGLPQASLLAPRTKCITSETSPVPLPLERRLGGDLRLFLRLAIGSALPAATNLLALALTRAALHDALRARLSATLLGLAAGALLESVLAGLGSHGLLLVVDFAENGATCYTVFRFFELSAGFSCFPTPFRVELRTPFA